MPKQTLAEKQAWMRARQLEKQRQERTEPRIENTLTPMEFVARKNLARRLSYMLESREKLNVQFLKAIIDLAEVAAENHLDEPTLTLSGRTRGVRHMLYEIKVHELSY